MHFSILSPLKEIFILIHAFQFRVTFDEESAVVRGLGEGTWLADWLQLTAVFNSCINPVIYGWHYYR